MKDFTPLTIDEFTELIKFAFMHGMEHGAQSDGFTDALFNLWFEETFKSKIPVSPIICNCSKELQQPARGNMLCLNCGGYIRGVKGR